MKKTIFALVLIFMTVKLNAQAYWIYVQAEELYNGNDSIVPDYSKAVLLYEKAAKMGCPMAEEKLSVCYYFGRGVPVSKKKAFLWCKKAAKHGVASSQYLLGYYYSLGEGCLQSHRKAYKWYYRAANRGDTDAIEFLQSVSLYIRLIHTWSN
jgi:TPR repeat protein